MKQLLILLYVFCLYQNILCQEITSSSLKFFLSEDFTNDNIELVDYSVKTSFTQFGTISTYIGFITNRSLPSFVINLFDKENNILYQTDDYFRSNSNTDFKNSVFVYHCYIPNIDSDLIKTIVIEKE